MYQKYNGDYQGKIILCYPERFVCKVDDLSCKMTE